VAAIFTLAVMAAMPGMAQQVVVYDASLTPTTTTTLPFALNSGGMMTFWTPTQLNSAAGPLREIGFQFANAIDRTWPRVRVVVGETSFNQRNLLTNYAENFNVPGKPPVIAYDGPLTVVTTTANAFGNIALTTPYNYSGQYSLVVWVTMDGTNTGTGTVLMRVQSIQVPSVNAVVSTTTSSQLIGDLTGRRAYGARFVFGAPTPTGPAIEVQDIRVSSGTFPVEGPNTLRAIVRNRGTTDYSNQPFTLEYSTDGGTTWPSSQSQTFTVPALAPSQTATVDFTASPWTVALGVNRVVVRVSPTTTTPLSSRLVEFRPDADVVEVSTGLNDPLEGANTVTVTIQNNGWTNLNGTPLALEYSTDGGTVWVAQQFLATTLSGWHSRQQFTFDAPWMRQGTAAATLRARIATVLSGDPDATDLLTRSYAEVVGTGTLVTFALGSSTSNDPWASTNTSGKIQQYFTREQLGRVMGTITEVGFNFTGSMSGTWATMRIEIGEVNLPGLLGGTLGPNFASNYNVPGAPAVTCLNGTNVTMSRTGSGYAMVPLTIPFEYSGQHSLLVTWYFSGPTGVTGTSTRYTSSTVNSRVTAMNLGDAATGTVSEAWSHHMRFRFQRREPGLSVTVASSGVATPDLGLGANSVKAVLKNEGSLPWSSPSVSVEYSIDGGMTYGVTESFTNVPTLQPGVSHTLTFTTPWTVGTVGRYTLVARLSTPIGTGRRQASHTYWPDIDLLSVQTLPTLPQMGNNTVRVTAISNGNFQLTDVPLPMAYEVLGAVSPVAQLFSTSTPWAKGTTKEFDFQTPWNIAAIAATTLTAKLVPNLPGDPDAIDSATVSYQDAGATGVPVTHISGTTGFSNGVAGSSGGQSKYQFWFTPTQVGGWGTITQVGFPFTAATHLNLDVLRIQLGEIDFSTMPGAAQGEWFMNNYNVPGRGPVTVFDGPTVIQTTVAAEPWRVHLTTPYYYSGDYPLLVTVYFNGSNPTFQAGGGRLMSGAVPTATWMSTSQDFHNSSVGVGTAFSISVRISQFVGPSVRIKQAKVASGQLQSGNNVVQAVVKNTGDVPLSTLALEYSTDGGVTFPPSQMQVFTLAPLSPLTETTLSFTTAWLSSIPVYSKLVIRTSTPIGTLDQSASKIFGPDADVHAVTVNPTTPMLGANTVQVTLKNNGNVSLNAAPMILRYTGDRGANYVTQTFTPQALASNGTTEVFTFTAPWVISAAGDQQIRVEISPMVSGDPDAADQVTLTYSAIGVVPPPTTTMNYTATTGSYQYTNSIPFSPMYSSSKVQVAWTPTLLGLSGPTTITGFGFRGDNNGFGGTWPSVRIEMGETTHLAATMTTNFNGNYNVPASPKTVVYDGPMTVPTISPFDFWRVPITPFQYSGTSNLLVTVLVTGANSTGASITYSGFHSRESGPCASVYSVNNGDAVTGLLNSSFNPSASFQLQSSTQGASLEVLSAGVVGDMVAMGVNTVTAVVKNSGTTDRSNTPFTLEYSTDGGVTYPAARTQTFTPTSLTPGQTTSVTFTEQWTANESRTHHLVVRINPGVGPLSQSRAAHLRPDPDVESVALDSTNAVLGDNVIRAIVANRGSVSLNGNPLTLRYVVMGPDGLLKRATQSFIPSQLGTLNGTETFTFTSVWNLTTPVAATLTVSIVPQVQGDPDPRDSLTWSYPNAGKFDYEAVVDARLLANPSIYANAGAITDGPFESNIPNKVQFSFKPHQLGFAVGYITGFGVQVAEAPGIVSRGNMRIEFGGTTYAAHAATTFFDTNYNMASKPKTIVFNGPYSVNLTVPDQAWTVPLDTPYYYTGDHDLLITMYATGAKIPTQGVKCRIVSGIGITENFSVRMSGNGDSPHGSLDTNRIYGARFRIEPMASGSALELDAIGTVAAGLPVVGNNTVKITVKNRGLSSLTAVPFLAEFSTDGGLTWPIANKQSFTPSALASTQSESFNFTTPWVITSAAPQTLVVRINPQIGPAHPERTLTCMPDADLISVGTFPVDPLPGVPAQVSMVVRNNGTLSLNGVPLTFRYSINGGKTWVQETFNASTLSATGSTETFNISQEWTPTIGRYVLFAELTTAIPGDPDTFEGVSRDYGGVGSTTSVLMQGSTISPSPTTNTVPTPFASQNAGTRLESLYLPADLTSVGLVAGSYLQQFEYKTTALPFYDIEKFRIRVEHSSLSQLSTGTTTAPFFITSTPIIQYGPSTIPLSAISIGNWLQFPMGGGFVWDGSSGILVELSKADSKQTTNFGDVEWRETATPRSSAVWLSATQVQSPFPYYPSPSHTTYRVPTLGIRHGLGVAATNLTVAANHVLANGVREVYLGESIPVTLTLTNSSALGCEVTELNYRAFYKATGHPCPAITFNILAPQVSVTSANFAQATVTMNVAQSWTGQVGEIEVRLVNGLAVVPSQSTTAMFVVPQTAPVSLVFVAAPPPPPVQILANSLPNATAGSHYSASIAATGGSGTYFVTVSQTSSDILPNGITLNPAANTTVPALLAGSATYSEVGTRQVKFACNDGKYIIEKTLTLVVQAGPIMVSTTALPNAMAGIPYATTLSGTGGNGALTWSLSPGSLNQLPPGIYLTATGLMAGTPGLLSHGTYALTIRCSDGSTHTDHPLTLVVEPSSVLSLLGPVSVSGKATVPLNFQLTAAGSNGPVVFSVATGSASPLPAGLTLSPATGAVSGTATNLAIGNYNVTFQVNDLNSQDTFAVQITILPPDPIVISPTHLADAVVGEPWLVQLSATGGSESFTFSVQSLPPLPPSLSFDAQSATLSGTPRLLDVGRYSVTITANDGAGNTPSHTLSLAVLASGAHGILVSEVRPIAGGFIEISHVGNKRVDLNGWNLDLWINGTAAIPLAYRSFPLGAQSLPGDIFQLNLGGNAGGTYPMYASGPVTLPAVTSGWAVALRDSNGNLVDFVASGTVVVASLLGTDSMNIGVRTVDWAQASPVAAQGLGRTSLTDTNTGADWTSSGSPTPLARNPGMPVPPPFIIADAVSTGHIGVVYSSQVLVVGGTPPYVFSNSTGTLPIGVSLSPVTGIVSGVPTVQGSFQYTIQVIDSLSISSQLTRTMLVVDSFTQPEVSVNTGSVSASALADTHFDVGIDFSAPLGARFIQFPVNLGQAEVVLTSASLGSSQSGAHLDVWSKGSGQYLVTAQTDLPSPSQLVSGRLVTLTFRVTPSSGPVATSGVFPIYLGPASATSTTGSSILAVQTHGSLDLSWYLPADVNRDGVIDVVDVQYVVNLILAITTPNYVGQGDANGDLAVDVVDVQTIVNCILSGTGCAE